MAAASSPSCFTRDAARACVSLTVHVQPGARNSAVAGLHGDALKIRIAAPAVDNKANAALLAFLSTCIGVRQSDMRIRHGHNGRRKTLEIADADAQVASRLHELLKALNP